MSDTRKRYEVRDQNGDVLDSFDSFALAQVRFRDWAGNTPLPFLYGAGVWDNEDETWNGTRVSWEDED